MRGFNAQHYQAIRREQAGKDAYRRFALAMAEFRDAIAEIAATSVADTTTHRGFASVHARPERHKKIVTKLRANGYRPLAEIGEEV